MSSHLKAELKMGKTGISSPGPRRHVSRPRIASLVVDSLARRFSVHSIGGQSSLGGSSRDLSRARRGSINPIPDIEPIPHAGLARSEEWASVQNAIWSIFQGNTLSSVESATVHQSIRRLSETELGPFIYDYYRHKLMPKGMQHLTEEVKSHEDGHIKGLETVWDNFYKEMLSSLKVVLHLIPIKDNNIRQLTLLGFRDYVLLKTNIENIFEKDDQLEITPVLQQMLLVLQSVRISDPPSENYIRLERLVGRVVNPYLGYLGIYKGSSEPEIPSTNYFSVIVSSQKVEDDISRVLPVRRNPRRSTFTTGPTLEPVKEMCIRDQLLLVHMTPRSDTPYGSPSASPSLAVRRLRDPKGRRHSCDILMH